MSTKLTLTMAMSLMATGSAFAECAFENTVPLKVLTAAFPAYEVIATKMEECGNVQVELDQEVRTKKRPRARRQSRALSHQQRA